MSSWFKIVWDTVKVFLLFVGFTVLFYYAMMWVDREYESYHKYDKPKGRSVEVYQATDKESETDWFQRFKLFYQTGE